MGRNIPDTYAASHIQATRNSADVAVEKPSNNKKIKYNDLATTNIFIPIAVKQVAHGALNLLSLLTISEGESLWSPMNPLRQHTLTRGSLFHFNGAMQLHSTTLSQRRNFFHRCG